MRRPDELQPLILESIGESVFTVDAEWRITSFNRAAEALTGFSREETLGRRCCDVFRADACEEGCPLARAVADGAPRRDVRLTILNRDMDAVPVSVSTAALLDAEGALIGGVEVMRDISELEVLRRALADRHVFEDMVGRSAPMRALFRLIPQVARAEVPILLEGPTGTGKEMAAQAIHRLSPRAEGPFIKINCGALPDALLESELFGHRKGAFTGAHQDRAGLFEAAEGGTLLLDEIGDTSPAFQVKLLRALQERRIRPLGGAETIPVDARIISATHRDLAAMVRAGTFREDLYYRLRVIPLTLPALRERPEDIPLLAEHLLTRVAALRGVRRGRFHPDVLVRLARHGFPGNVRELENLIERAIVLRGGEEICPEHLPPELEQAEVTLTSSEAARLRAALNAHGWERRATARALGISRTTLWRKMKRYGLIGCSASVH